jgi:uncharacterized membrane protein
LASLLIHFFGLNTAHKPMQKIFAAIMTFMIIATVLVVFVLGALSLTGGSVTATADQKDKPSAASPAGDGSA